MSKTDPILQVRVESDLLRWIDRVAAGMGLSRSGYVRMVLYGAVALDLSKEAGRGN